MQFIAPEEPNDGSKHNCSGRRLDRSTHSHASIFPINFLGSDGILPVKLAKG